MSAKHSQRFYSVIALILFLILFGIAFIINTYQDYVQRFIEIQDSKQLQLAQSVDRNIESLLKQSRNSLEYIIDLEQFQKAEQQWLESGNNRDILRYLTENHLDRNELIAAIAVLQDGSFIRDEHGRPSFEFLNDDQENSHRICRGVTGNIYLAVICEGRGNISYASMIDLQLLYKEISNIELAHSDQLILLDKNRSILQHFCTDTQEYKNTLVESCPQRKDFQLLLRAEEQQEQNCYSFVYQTKNMDKGYNAHIMVLPSSLSENQSFAIGLVSNIDQALQPLRFASLRWLLGGAILLIGISLLLILVLLLRHRDLQTAEELKLLQQKNVAMEELNRKTQEMAHRQRLEMIGTLTSGIAHEFNNLLTPIMGYSMLTLEQLPPELEEIYDNVLEIYQSSRKAKEITSQLSLYSRKNSGDNRVRIIPNQLIQKVLHVASPSCSEEVTIKTDFKLSTAQIYGNETQLSQLFLNLIINAIHAMPDGGILTISAQEVQGFVQISISDEGCGIPEKILPHIFEPFFTTKEGGKGSGLGLAIVQQITENHQGHIEAHSTEGQGSTFTVSLPAYYD